MCRAIIPFGICTLRFKMRWLDYYLHAFRLAEPGNSETMEIGIADDDEFMPDRQTVAGWEVALSSHFDRPGQTAV